MTSTPDTLELHRHVARFAVALARLVELERDGALSEAEAAHQGGYAVDAARKFAQIATGPLHVTFTARVPFVRHIPLQAAPWVFQHIESLASALHEHGWSDLRLEQTIGPEDVIALAKLIASPSHDGPPQALRNVTLGAESFGDMATVLTVDRDAPSTTLSSAYASVVAALWDARNGIARGEMPSLVRLTRAAQVVVELAETRRLAATNPTATRIGDDTAARSVDTSVLAVEMCQLVTEDRVVLRAVALAGLLLALAPFDERGATSQDGPPSVGRGRRIVSADRLAARTLGLIIGVPQVGRSARAAASLAFEAQRRRYRFLSGSGRPSFAATEALALATAIRFFELRAKHRGDDVLDAIVDELRAEAVDEGDEVALRMLLGALGAVPRGAVVELDTREVAVVVSASREGLPPEPEIELLVDPDGNALQEVRKVDLAKLPRAPERRRSLRAVLALRVDGDAIPSAGSRAPSVREVQEEPVLEELSVTPQRRWERRKPAFARPSSSRPKEGVPLGLEILEDFVEPGEQ